MRRYLLQVELSIREDCAGFFFCSFSISSFFHRFQSLHSSSESSLKRDLFFALILFSKRECPMVFLKIGQNIFDLDATPFAL